MNEEQWRPISGHPNYEVSDLGRVRSLGCVVHHQPRPGKILKQSEKRHQSGRLMAMRVNLGRGNGRYVHRLVLSAFVGPCPEGQEGCHNDGNPRNNALSNLRWDTRYENMQDVKRHGTHFTPFGKQKGEESPNAKLTTEAVRQIRAADVSYRGAYTELSRRFGVSAVQIKRVIDRETWAHV